MNDLVQHLLVLLALLRENPATLGIVLGFVTPLAVSVLQQPNLSKRQRTAVGVLAALVIGGLTAYGTGLFDDAKNALELIVVLYLASEAAYQRLWKQIGLTQQIEAKTTLPSAVVNGEVVNEGE